MLVAPQKTAPRPSQLISSHISLFFAAMMVVWWAGVLAVGGTRGMGGIGGWEAVLTRFDI